MRDISHVLLLEWAHSLRYSFCFFVYCQINSKSVLCIPVQQYEYESDFLSRWGGLVYIPTSPPFCRHLHTKDNYAAPLWLPDHIKRKKYPNAGQINNVTATVLRIRACLSCSHSIPACIVSFQTCRGMFFCLIFRATVYKNFAYSTLWPRFHLVQLLVQNADILRPLLSVRQSQG